VFEGTASGAVDLFGELGPRQQNLVVQTVLNRLIAAAGLVVASARGFQFATLGDLGNVVFGKIRTV